MNCWICKHCNQKSYSAYDYHDQRKVTCVVCGKENINTYYRPQNEVKSELDYAIETYETQQHIGKLHHIETSV